MPGKATPDASKAPKASPTLKWGFPTSGELGVACRERRPETDVAIGRERLWGGVHAEVHLLGLVGRVHLRVDDTPHLGPGLDRRAGRRDPLGLGLSRGGSTAGAALDASPLLDQETLAMRARRLVRRVEDRAEGLPADPRVARAPVVPVGAEKVARLREPRAGAAARSLVRAAHQGRDVVEPLDAVVLERRADVVERVGEVVRLSGRVVLRLVVEDEVRLAAPVAQELRLRRDLPIVLAFRDVAPPHPRAVQPLGVPGDQRDPSGLRALLDRVVDQLAVPSDVVAREVQPPADRALEALHGADRGVGPGVDVRAPETFGVSDLRRSPRASIAARLVPGGDLIGDDLDGGSRRGETGDAEPRVREELPTGEGLLLGH